MEIDWSRVAEPQADGYDVEVMRYYLAQGSYGRKTPRPLPQDAERIWPEADARFVRLAHHSQPHPQFVDLPPTHPHVSRGLELLELWPEFRPLARALVALCPFSSTGFVQAQGHGGTCGNFGDDWGWIYASADNPWGLAEGIVHEMNHWKLRAFGIWFEDWTLELLDNRADELYTSPVRKDIARPMGAVLHAQYSYIAVAEMCCRMLAAESAPNLNDVEWTALQISRITEGQATLRAHARGRKPAGVTFLAGVDAWTARVISEGSALIDRRRQELGDA